MQTASRPVAPRKLGYRPALDGLRALSVVAVILYHADVSWMPGGFLGVEVFFVVSGFLITSLLLAERTGTGAIDLRAFWTRRVRRLMPASLAAIALAVAFGLLAADPLQRQELGGDVVASLGYVANWWFLFSGQSYGELFVAPSPLLHFWSLAIEEQFYLLFPLVAWAALGRSGWGRRRFGALLAGLTAVSIALPFVLPLSDDAIYYATPTRAAELLIGALLAVVVQHDRLVTTLTRDRRLQVAVSTAGLVALVGCATLWATTAQSSGWLYRGGFAAYAVLSALIVLAALLPGGPVEALLGGRALQHLGRISYGVYVYHWPLFLWIDERRTGLEGWPLFAVRVAVTLALAEASARLLEIPVRRGARLGPVRPIRLAGPAVAALVAVALLASATAPPPAVDFAAAEQALADAEAGAVPGALPGPAAPAPVEVDLLADEAPQARIAVFGDSTALLTATGLQRWADETGEVEFVPGISQLGCGVGRGGERRAADGRVEATFAHCDSWEDTWAEKVRVFGPSIAVVQVGPWETMDRRLPGDDQWRSLGDPVYDAWLLDEMVTAVDALTVDGASVVWLTSPPVNDNVDRAGDFGASDVRDPARMARLNELIAQLPERRPDQVEVVDLAGWLASSGRDAELRPDGVHFDDAGALDAARAYLGPALLDAHRRLWDETAPARAEQAAALAAAGPAVIGPEPGEPWRVLVWGDAPTGAIGQALEAWGAAGDDLEVTTVAPAGCGVTTPDARRVDGELVPVPEPCRARTELWEAVARVDPHAVLVVPGRFELADQLVAGEPTTLVAPNTGVYDDWARADLGAVADALHDGRRAVLVGASPPFRIDGDPAGDMARVVRVNQLAAELAASRARRDWMAVVDLAGATQAWPGGPLAPDLRPGGVDYSPEAARRMAEAIGLEIADRLDELAAAPRTAPDPGR